MHSVPTDSSFLPGQFVPAQFVPALFPLAPACHGRRRPDLTSSGLGRSSSVRVMVAETRSH